VSVGTRADLVTGTACVAAPEDREASQSAELRVRQDDCVIVCVRSDGDVSWLEFVLQFQGCSYSVSFVFGARRAGHQCSGRVSEVDEDDYD
jgi:hypothetical protein